MSTESIEEVKHVVISGAGIVGLILALALKKHVNVTAEIFEKATKFEDYVGAGMCMFSNGLRVIRDISPNLLQKIRDCGYPLLIRRFERHDGTGILEADENARHCQTAEELHAIGICRWRLHKVLYEAVLEEGITIHFSKRTESLGRMGDYLKLNFSDGTHCCTRILFGVDSSNSTVRKIMLSKKAYELKYTGVTCIMGIAKDLPCERGVSFPSSSTTKCHACFFPTKENEQCFQFYFPVPVHVPTRHEEGDWRVLSNKMGQRECENLANRLRFDGWHEKYLAPLMHVQKAVRIGFCQLNPYLRKIVYITHNKKSFTVLLGDAAHTPVPYTGQGAQLGIEDAGVIALLLQRIYPNIAQENTPDTFQPNLFKKAMEVYEKIRTQRTQSILDQAQYMGNMQQKRATDEKYNAMKEEVMKRDFFFHENLPIYDDATKYDYYDDVQNAIRRMNASSEAMYSRHV